MKCAACGTENDSHSLVCRSCGSILSDHDLDKDKKISIDSPNINAQNKSYNKLRKPSFIILVLSLVAAITILIIFLIIHLNTSHNNTDSSGKWIDGYHTGSKRSSSSIEFETFSEAFYKINNTIKDITRDSSCIPYMVYSGYNSNSGKIRFKFNLNDASSNAVADLDISINESDFSVISFSAFTYKEDKTLLSDLLFGIFESVNLDLPYTFDELFEQKYTNHQYNDETAFINVEYNYVNIRFLKNN